MRRPEAMTMTQRLWQHRDLVVSLVRRQYQVRYRQSFIGIVWAIAPPLFMLAAATLVFDVVARVDTGRSSYPMFAFAALAPWTFLANALTFGVPSITFDQQMVTRLPFPRAALPLSMLGASLVDLAIASGVFVVFAYATGNTLPVTAAWYPALLLIEIALASGIVLLGSAVNVFARDIRQAVPLLVQMWLFLTPVLYPLGAVPVELRRWYQLNPMTGLVESFRRVLLDGDAPDPSMLLSPILGALVGLMVGVWYFAATEKRFADVI
jgi:lipopolysaccharide transport system permease protein